MSTPGPLLDTTSASLFPITNLQKGGKYRVAMSWMFDRYAVSTQVSAGDVPPYDTTSDPYMSFTKPDRFVPSNVADVTKAAAAAVGGEKNPWLKARRIYDWLLNGLSYSPNAADTVAALRTKKGNSFVYSALYCALLRAAGVPSRMVSGYLVGDSGTPTRRHFWDEFYVETLGWVPVDPVLGEERSLVPGTPQADFDTHAFYFGGLDNQHVTMTKGARRGEPDEPLRPGETGQGPALSPQHRRGGGGRDLVIHGELRRPDCDGNVLRSSAALRGPHRCSASGGHGLQSGAPGRGFGARHTVMAAKSSFSSTWKPLQTEARITAFSTNSSGSG